MAINFPASPSTNDEVSQGNMTWFWNGTYWELKSTTSKFTASDDAPTSYTEGDFWYESDTGKLFIRYDSTWAEVGHASDGQSFQAGDAIPAASASTAGDIWFESDSGGAFIYYNDGSSSQWVELGHSVSGINVNIDGGVSGTNYGGITALDGGAS